MKRLIMILFIFVFCGFYGCANFMLPMSDRQAEAWEKIEVAKAKAKGKLFDAKKAVAIDANKPKKIAEYTPERVITNDNKKIESYTPSTFTVYNQTITKPMEVREDDSQLTRIIGKTLDTTVKLANSNGVQTLGMGLIAKSIAEEGFKAAGDRISTGDGATITSKSGNTITKTTTTDIDTKVATDEGVINENNDSGNTSDSQNTDDNSDNSNNSDNSDNSDNTNNSDNSDNTDNSDNSDNSQTATPTVVRPEIVTQPEPIIVEQNTTTTTNNTLP